MASTFIEAVLRLKAEGDLNLVTQWLEERGCTVVPIEAGLLLSGSSRSIADIFGEVLHFGSAAKQLPIPKPLGNHVELIEIPREKHLM